MWVFVLPLNGGPGQTPTAVPPTCAAVDPSLYSECVCVCLHVRDRERERKREREREWGEQVCVWSGAGRGGEEHPIQPRDLFTTLLTTEEEH